LFGDLPRQDKSLPKALNDPAAAKFLRAAQNQPRPLFLSMLNEKHQRRLPILDFPRGTRNSDYRGIAGG
jgi:hypothetical protein